MNKFILAGLLTVPFIIFSDDRENLKEIFDTQDTITSAKLQKVETQIEMNEVVGEIFLQKKKNFIQSAEYRLRQAKTRNERIAVLNKVYETAERVHKTLDKADENMGSINTMLKCCRASSILSRQTDIWLLSGEKYAEWTEVSSAKLILDGKVVKLKDGVGEYMTEIYGSQISLEISTLPDECFRYSDKTYCIITEDMVDSVSTDFLKTYLCVIESEGKLKVLLDLDSFLFSDIKIDDDTLIISGEDEYSGKKKQQRISLDKI